MENNNEYHPKPVTDQIPLGTEVDYEYATIFERWFVMAAYISGADQTLTYDIGESLRISHRIAVSPSIIEPVEK